MSNRRGIVLIACYLLVATLVALGSAGVVRSFTEQRTATRYQELARAFELAEAGVDQALVQLRGNYAWQGGTTTLSPTSSYTVSVTQNSGLRTIQSVGTVNTGTAISRRLQVVVQQAIPSNFYGNSIYAAGTVVFKGNAYNVVGNVLVGSTNPINNTGNVHGTLTQDPSASPLPKLSFQQLYNLAVSQGNVYDAARLQKIQQHQDAFPTAFCYSPPTDPNDPSTCVPNVNYVTADLVLNGNIGTIGGFFVVVGNVLTDPNATQDTTINGSGQVAGSIYTSGTFDVNGGGNNLNVDGGVWAGEDARLNGNVTIQYNATYVNAIKNLNISPDVQLLVWQECPPSGCSS